MEQSTCESRKRCDEKIFRTGVGGKKYSEVKSGWGHKAVSD